MWIRMAARDAMRASYGLKSSLESFEEVNAILKAIESAEKIADAL